MIENFEQYAVYLNHWIRSQEKKGFGLRKKIADMLGVKTSYISQVLSGAVVLKEEYALPINALFQHTELEGDYFIALVSVDRATNHQMKQYYKKKAREIRERLKELVQATDLTKIIDHEALFEEYYSSWIYTAVHALSGVIGIDSEILKQKLQISDGTATKVLKYLAKMELIVQEGQYFRHSGLGLHLPKENKWVNRHHINWKIKTAETLNRGESRGLHYTSVATMSSKEMELVKQIIYATIQEIRHHIAKAKDEEVYCYSIDFYPVIEGSK
jgi:uncharacterized protein (TIGR02147 family)